jgi:hypothetical protein
MKFTAIDISRMTSTQLVNQPRPISYWPVEDIDVDKIAPEVCIASWHRDVVSIHEISNRLSECAWDAIHLGFHYMLCDIVSLPQQAPDISERVIEFSRLYSKLHAVISYNVDPDLTRPWLRHEAYQILTSRTSLAYLIHKWRLRIPLINSLIINQVCVRRLGITNFNKSRLPLCDTDRIYQLTISDLRLLDIEPPPRLSGTISLDRRSQEFASDVLLVYELGLPTPRTDLIAKLTALRSNSVLSPALCIIWAMLEGLSLSIRGCDWSFQETTKCSVELIRDACTRLNWPINLSIANDHRELTLRGAINVMALLEKTESSRGLCHPDDILIRRLDQPAGVHEQSIIKSFLNQCLDCATERAIQRVFPEPDSLREEKYSLGFEEYTGPCSTRKLPY